MGLIISNDRLKAKHDLPIVPVFCGILGSNNATLGLELVNEFMVWHDQFYLSQLQSH